MVSLKLTTILLAASVLTAPAVARAQAAAPSAPAVANLDEIVVTAQKRSEAVQDVPINISAFNTASLAQAGITTPGDIQRLAPTFKFTTSIGTLAARFSIRGVGTFSNSAVEPSVATFIDGIYIPRPASIVNSLLDIQTVEVLSGPQGTLFGRNASVGALSFHTGEPVNYFVDTVRADYSTGDHFRLENVLNVPVNDKVAVRFAGLADLFDGYWKDDRTGKSFGGVDTYQGRLSVKSQLSENLTWTVRGDYQQNKGDGLLNAKLVPTTLTAGTLANITAAQGGVAPNLNEFSTHNNSFNGHAIVDDSIWGVSSDLTFKTAGDYSLRLLNGYYDWDSKQGDGDTASLSVYALGRDLHYTSQSYSHELQIISPKDQLLGGKADFVGGLYYFNEDLGIRQDSLNGPSFCDVVIPRIAAAAFPGLPGTDTASRVAACKTYGGPSSRGDFNQSTRSMAAYVQATYKVLPQLDLTGGLRYTDEKKTGSYIGTLYNPTGAILVAPETTKNLGLKDDRLTWRTNLAWRPAKDMMVFGTVSTGFKSGGFNNGIATRSLGQDRIFKAETVTNYELGVKSQFLDRKLTLNATAFRMDIDNFQERSIIGLISSIRNVGKVRQQGVEFEGVARPADGLRLNASITYLDSTILSYCNAPLPPYLPNAPASTNCPGAPATTQDLKGASLNYTPEWSGVVGAQVDGTFGGGSPLRWTLNGDVNFTSSQQQGTTIDNGPLTFQKAYALLNARFTVFGSNDKWSVGVYARNLTNTGYCASTVYQVLEGPLGLRYDNNGDGRNDGTAVRCNLGAPRVVGVSASARF